MTSLKFVFHLTCLFFFKVACMTQFSSNVQQQRGFVSKHVGQSVTLECFYDDDKVANYYWYKQTLGAKPRLITSFYTYNPNGTFYDEFNNNPRFALETGNGRNHLRISDLHSSDSAIYYCASSHSVTFEFGEGATVSVKGSVSNSQASVLQSESEIIQPGGSVTLNCTVHTGSCDGGHSVYWFKDPEESHPGLIYTHGDRNDQCEWKPDTQTHTCVYNLAMTNLNRSHTGTYYCGVASCGHILFGNGTKLDIEDVVDYHVLVYVLSSALAFTIILSILLAFLLCFLYKRNSCLCTGEVRVSTSPMMNTECKNEESIHYAALEVKKANHSRKQRGSTEDGCVYSSVKH